MNRLLNISDEEHERIGRRIENLLEFTRDVLDDPAILEHIPSGSQVRAIPIGERDPSVRYDVETPRMLAIVTPPESERTEPSSRSHGHTRRIDRDHATRLKRIRAAHR